MRGCRLLSSDRSQVFLIGNHFCPFFKIHCLFVMIFWFMQNGSNLCAPVSTCGVLRGKGSGRGCGIRCSRCADLPNFPLWSWRSQPVLRLECCYTCPSVSCALGNNQPTLFQWQLSSNTVKEKFVQGENSSLMVAMEMENWVII